MRTDTSYQGLESCVITFNQQLRFEDDGNMAHITITLCFTGIDDIYLVLYLTVLLYDAGYDLILSY